MKISRYLAAGALAALLLCSACERRPNGVLSDSEMADLLADLHIAQAYVDQNTQQFMTDSARKAFRQGVLAEHGVTTEQLDSTLAWYGRHMEKYSDLYARVEVNLQKREQSLTKSGEAKAAGAGDLFILPRMVMLSPQSRSGIYKFSFPANELAKGEGVELQFRMVDSETGRMPDFFLAIDYSDNSANFTTSAASSLKGKVEARLSVDSVKTPTRVYGWIRARGSEEHPLWLDSLQLRHYVMTDGMPGRTHLPPSKERGRKVARKVAQKDTTARVDSTLRQPIRPAPGSPSVHPAGAQAPVARPTSATNGAPINIPTSKK